MFEDVANKLERPKIRDIETGLLTLTRQVFREETDPFGVPWRALNPATLRDRRRRGQDSTNILFDTGALFASIDSKIQGDTVTVQIGGTGQGGADSVEFHQFGRGVPQRKMLPLSEPIPENWWNTVEAPILKGLDL